MSNQEDFEVKLNDIMFLALDHGMDSIYNNSGPLIPFALIETRNGERKLQRFVTETIEGGVERAKEYIENNSNDIDRYAIAWDGFVTIEGQQWDAILVEAGDKVQQTGFQMCQRYETIGLLKKKNKPLGNPALIGNPKSRLK